MDHNWYLYSIYKQWIRIDIYILYINNGSELIFISLYISNGSELIFIFYI